MQKEHFGGIVKFAILFSFAMIFRNVFKGFSFLPEVCMSVTILDFSYSSLAPLNLWAIGGVTI